MIAACEWIGPYADIVVVGENLPTMADAFRGIGFQIERHAHSVNAYPPSELRIQFTIDPRYAGFSHRSVIGEVLGVPVRIACLDDLAQGGCGRTAIPRGASEAPQPRRRRRG